ncbi:MAG: glutamate--cysteine ligase [Cyanobacteria bacterium]|nr:glutamate--cysteine ligase [Cyanobacteriota bacterium]
MLSKGFEIEVYTGTPNGDIVGLSDRIVADLEGFIREPDSRNVEYTTAPSYRYERSLLDLLQPRATLRDYLKPDGYTLIPGSTLPLAGSANRFWRSDPENPYHTYIEQTYGTKVVTASVHINIGVSDPDVLMRLCRLVRVEAPLYLALSASSPFFNGDITGSHSTRWSVFPKTPAFVPLFTSHQDFIAWTEKQLRLGTMQNVRHLWSSVRPNGDRRPYILNRLEMRICDLVSNPIDLLAITALLEARLIQAMENPELDPLVMSEMPIASRGADLVAMASENELLAAKSSLDSTLTHWQTGKPIVAREWIQSLYEEVWPTAKQEGFSCFLLPIKKILREGNESIRWIQLSNQGWSREQVIEYAIEDMKTQEMSLRTEVSLP